MPTGSVLILCGHISRIKIDGMPKPARNAKLRGFERGLTWRLVVSSERAIRIRRAARVEREVTNSDVVLLR